MINIDVLSRRIEQLHRETSSQDARTAIETLLRIYRNIWQNQDDAKYRKLNLNNPAFQKKIWKFASARSFLLAGGWFMEDGQLFFSDDSCLSDIISLLVDRRFVMPSEEEWVDETKCTYKSEAQIREEELRRKAALERDKELKEFLEDKKKREDLARDVKAEHEADKYRRRALKPEVGNQLTKGAKIQTLYSRDSKE